MGAAPNSGIGMPADEPYGKLDEPAITVAEIHAGTSLQGRCLEARVDLAWKTETKDGQKSKRIHLNDLSGKTPAQVDLWVYGDWAATCDELEGKDMIRLTGGTLEPYSDHDFDESKHNIVIKADAKAKLQIRPVDESWGRVLDQKRCRAPAASGARAQPSKRQKKS